MKHIKNTLVFVVLYFTANVFAQKGSSCVTPDNRIGQCITLRSCPALLSLIVEKKTTDPKVLNFVKKSQCGYEDKQPKVCCVVDGNLKDASVSECDADPILCDIVTHPRSGCDPASYGAAGSYNESVDNSHLLPDTSICGLSKANRIVGGQLTALGEFPWMALLEYITPNGRDFRCGGSLINNRYVLTAAHCIRRIPKTWTLVGVRLGEFDLNVDPDCEGSVPGLEDCSDKPLNLGIEEKIVYEQYEPDLVGQYHDIALLRLDKNVTFSASVKPICLPITPEMKNRQFTGENLTVAGWGRTEFRSQNNIMLKVEVPIKSDSDCMAEYTKRANVTLANNQLCAGGVKGEDSCTGDSGGPLMVKNRTPKENNWYAIALVSFGPTPCGIKDYPGVYTRLPPYMNWISSNIKP